MNEQERIQRACVVALEKWAAAPQWRMLQEECAELIAAINQYDRGRVTEDRVAEEVADVLIMVAQARVLLGDRVDAWLRAKLERLERRLGLA